MIVKLIEEEIRRKYPPTRNESREEILNTTYTLHCSQAFATLLRRELSTIGFISAGEGEVMLDQISKLQTPCIGILNIILDMEEGYRIELTRREFKSELIGEDKNRRVINLEEGDIIKKNLTDREAGYVLKIEENNIYVKYVGKSEREGTEGIWEGSYIKLKEIRGKI